MAADIAPTLRDRRTRLLTLFAAVTLGLVVIAGLSLWLRAGEAPGPIDRRAMFPDLRARQGDAARIEMSSGGSRFTIVRGADGGWIVPGKGGWPADLDQVKRAINGLVQLDLVERKTANPERHAALRLGAPAEGSDSVGLTLADASGTPLAALIAGRVVTTPGPATDGAIFVRRPDEDQTWLARGFLTLQTDEAAWLDKTFVRVAPERIARVVVSPKEGPEYTLLKGADPAGFSLTDIPDGQQIIAPSAPNGVARALADLTFEDVRPLGAFPFAEAEKIVFATGDGLAVTISLTIEDGAYWAAFSAVGEAPPPPLQGEGPAGPPPAADPIAEAAALNAMTGGYAFRLPRYKAELMTTPRASLLVETPPEPEAPAPDAPAPDEAPPPE